MQSRYLRSGLCPAVCMRQQPDLQPYNRPVSSHRNQWYSISKAIFIRNGKNILFYIVKSQDYISLHCTKIVQVGFFFTILNILSPLQKLLRHLTILVLLLFSLKKFFKTPLLTLKVGDYVYKLATVHQPVMTHFTFRSWCVHSQRIFGVISYISGKIKFHWI